MTKKDQFEPKFSEVYLKPFLKNNPHAEVSVEDDNLIIDNPWNRSDARLKAKVSDHEFIGVLNETVFNSKYDAIFYSANKVAEFIFAYVDPESSIYKDLVERSFIINFEGQEYNCRFGEPSKNLLKISQKFERLPSDASIKSVPQIIPFRDGQNLDSMDEKVRDYFKKKVPRCFYVESKVDFSSINFESLCKHLNFLMSYYDRETPIIEINLDMEQELYKNRKPIRFAEDCFPKNLVLNSLDDIILKLIDVARISAPRFAYLYYYQVFEYAGYYYIDENAKRILRKYLKDPSLVNCNEEKVTELFSILSDLNHADDVKMKKVIEEYCNPRVLWKEICNDKEFFSKDHEFEGGFVIKGLISMDASEDAWSNMWMPKLYDHLTKIRNSLVHARERRENKVILPTRENNSILRHYIPLIQRVAEQIALRSQ